MESPNDLIRLLESRVSQANAIKAAFPNDPGMAAKLIRYLISNTASGNEVGLPPEEKPVLTRKNTTGRISHWDRIVEHFRETKNQYISIPKLAKRLGVHRGIVSGCIYNSHPSDVESDVNPKRKGGKVWRLKVAPQASLLP